MANLRRILEYASSTGMLLATVCLVMLPVFYDMIQVKLCRRFKVHHLTSKLAEVAKELLGSRKTFSNALVAIRLLKACQCRFLCLNPRTRLILPQHTSRGSRSMPPVLSSSINTINTEIWSDV